jgi:hypothetical protein
VTIELQLAIVVVAVVVVVVVVEAAIIIIINKMFAFHLPVRCDFLGRTSELQKVRKILLQCGACSCGLGFMKWGNVL